MTRDGRDSFSPYDEVLEEADLSLSPWDDGEYFPDWDLFQRLLAIPISLGHADTQQSGATAKAFDVWIAHELRRAGFPVDSGRIAAALAERGFAVTGIDLARSMLDQAQARAPPCRKRLRRASNSGWAT